MLMLSAPLGTLDVPVLPSVEQGSIQAAKSDLNGLLFT